ncbi:unnamed protein product, partial [Symbiodinium sp. KB8]
MDDQGGGGDWLRRWRRSCWDQRVGALVALLDEDSDTAKSCMASISVANVSLGAAIAGGEGHLALLRELISLAEALSADMRGAFDVALIEACSGGHIDIVRELLALDGPLAVNVHADDGDGPEAAFRRACKHGHLEV